MTMAGHRHLHELLKEDQEPFHLKNYIADRRCQLKRPNPPKTTLQVKKRKPIIETPTTITKRSLCKHACFFSFHNSPDVTKSPFPDFLSPARSPLRTQNGRVFLHVPARTAALLLEAAVRIQKQQSSSHSKPKAQIRNMGLGLLSSIIKKLKDRKRNKKCEIRDSEVKSSRNNEVIIEENVDERISREIGFSCSCNNSRLSSAGWSESNEERSLDMETSTSSYRSEYSDETDSTARGGENDVFASCQKRFCSSPLSSFKFSLQRSTSSGRKTPNFSSPVTSPSRRKEEEKKNYEAEGLEKNQLEEEDEKEQSSPVSVLEPPFENEDGHDSGDDEDYDVECSFAIVQRAKEQLLYKLRRFEKLAELDPVELEKRMMEQLDDEDEDEDEEQDQADEGKTEDNEFWPLYRSCSLDSFVNEVFSKSDLLHQSKIPADMKRLVSDLITDEDREIKCKEKKEIVLGRVCKKLDSWKEVESNTIDMMIELDFRSELDQWKRFQDQREETVAEIELAIFGLLMEELREELV